MESDDAVHSHGYQSDGITHFDEHSATAAAISSCPVGQYSAHCRISSMITLVVLLLGGPIMQLYGKGFSDKMPLVYLALSNIFSAYSNIIEMSIYSKNKMWQAFVINLFWAIVLLVSAYCLVERGLNATGIALAVLIAYGLKSILATLYLTLFLKR